MGVERKVTRRVFLGILAGTAVGFPFLHPESTLRAMGAILGKSVDCGNNKEPQGSKYPFDAIVVPGAGIVETIDGNHTPSELGKMRLEAAAIAYSKGLAPSIVLVGWENTPKENGFTQKIYLQDAFKKLTGNLIPDEAILIEGLSINTATNMEELSKHNIKTALIVTNRFHKERSTLFACEYGIAASSLSAEDLILKQDPTRAEAIRAMYDSWEIKLAQAKEELELVLAIWDPKGAIPTLLKGMAK